MNGDERQMISGLFDRMRGVGQVDKDREAEALINDQVRRNPDAAYLLVQSVLVQEHALQQAGGRIEELEERVRELESRAPAPAQQGGSFLGGLFGGGAGRSSVPAAGQQSPGFGQQRPMGRPMGQPAGTPWGGQQAGAPWGQQPMQPQQRAGGGFLATAMTTAAGVAGGMLLANSISGMLGGNSAQAATPAAGQGAEGASMDQAALGPPVPDNLPPADQGYQNASWEDSGGDFGGGDFET
ncbi:MAG: DUF2076 domain-containing protein [Hyphomicrobiaceae bacterium]|jgi:hypothetical protein